MIIQLLRQTTSVIPKQIPTPTATHISSLFLSASQQLLQKANVFLQYENNSALNDVKPMEYEVFMDWEANNEMDYSYYNTCNVNAHNYVPSTLSH